MSNIYLAFVDQQKFITVSIHSFIKYRRRKFPRQLKLKIGLLFLGSLDFRLF